MKTNATARALELLEEDGVRAVQSLQADALEGKTVLITGASGLIGTGLLAALRALKKSGQQLRLIAHGFSEAPAPLQAWKEEGSLELLRSNLADSSTWADLPQADVIIHAAGYGQPGKFLEAQLQALMMNTGATGALLGKLRAEGRFLFFSSTEVYQGLSHSLLRETDIGTTSPDHPRSAYIEGKRTGEAFCQVARREGIHAQAIRLAHTYGPGTRAGDRRVINMFIEKALRDGKIAMQDEGTALRTWGYLTDVVETCLNVLLHGREAVYNVGGRSRLTIRELAEAVGRITGVPVTAPAASQSVAGAPAHVEADLSRAETEFNKKEYVSLDEGLARTIDYQRSFYCS